MIKKLKLGDLLVEHKVISFYQLEQALRHQHETGKKLGDVLIELGFLDETALLLFLAKQLQLPFLELGLYRIKPEVIRELPESYARRFGMIPIDRLKNEYLVAIGDPTDLVAYDEVAKKLKRPLRLVVVRQKDLSRVIDEVYRRTEEIVSLGSEVEQEIGLRFKTEIEDVGVDAPIKKLLNSIFEDALQVNASDIHLEPAEKGLRIRQRIDGILHEQVLPGDNIIHSLILRLKLMAKLNISERRLPQEGRFTIHIKNKKIDVRMSTLPLFAGEAVVMRLLSTTTGLLQLEDLGMEPLLLARYRYHLMRPQGMILVCGPTGSGKSTTLYASLLALNSQEKKIITIEDPVEYSFDRLNQIQVKPKIGLSFSTILRSCLRNDPDILMVGEIRDEETAQIALRAAMTGHLVLSTLHTNDALSAPIRLMDIGVEGYVTASALRFIVAQRLARRLCVCIERHLPSQEEINTLHNLHIEVDPTQLFFRGKGCTQCENRGYKGRIGIYEAIEITPRMSDLLRSGELQQFRLEALQSGGYRQITSGALDLASTGVISLEEMLRLSIELLGEGSDALPL